MARISRRQLLKRAAAGAAAGLAAPYLIPAGVLAADGKPGANERVGIGAIGVGGRASLLLNQLPDDGRIVALCDCNLPKAEAFRQKKKASWPVYQHYQELLDRKDVDAVIVATGEFQRVLPCIHACQAGKDIYAEKPLTLYIQEGRALVRAVRRYNRILQVGTQQRSMAMNRVACELVRTGGLGKVLEVQAVCYTGSVPASGELPEQAVPAGLDWDMWLNQSSWRPYNEEWMHWLRKEPCRDFGGGETTNWGAHGLDQVQWALGTSQTGPVEVWPVTPGPHGKVSMRYANGVPLNLSLDMKHGPMGGAIFVCEKGKLEINRNKFASNPKPIAEQLRKKLNAEEEERKWSDQTALWQARWHMQNWLDCAKSRQLPVADVEIGHRSVAVCHLANLARWLGRKLRWDPEKELFVGDDEANKLVSRPRRKGYGLPG